MKQQINIQDGILNEVRKNKIPVTIFLINGYQFTGQVIGFDNFTIVLKIEDKEQMVYKHAVSTIIPQESIKDLFQEK
ncbi:MAG: RNA chaperone Hfq [Halanaerobiaceae bacterium]|jgi:host factor-I protein|nr:RNA chaperone Hfq [Halanaerobiaceae bacterium]